MPNIAQFREDQYPATDELQCITVYIPAGDEFKWLLAGLLRLPTLASSYLTPDSDQADGLAAVWADAYQYTDWSECVPAYDNLAPGNINLFTFMSEQDALSSWTSIFASFIPFGYAMQSGTGSPSASGEAAYNSVYLPAGNYSYTGVYAKTVNSGIIDVQLRNASGSTLITTIVDNLDLYGLFNAMYTVTASFTVASDGNYRIDVRKFNSKNPSSGGYQFSWTSHHIRRNS